MIKLKDLLNEGKFQMKGKYLYMPDGEMSSIPGDFDRDVIKFTIGRDSFGVYKEKGKLHAYGSKYSQEFKNEKALVAWLNRKNAKYLGIDDR